MSPSRPRRFVALLAFAACATAQAATVQVTVLARDGQPLADAVVLIEPANATSAPTPAPVQARIDQERMQFAPMLTLVPTGSTLRFTNLDRWEHHVRMLPAAITFSAPGATEGNASNCFKAKIEEVTYLGQDTQLRIVTQSGDVCRVAVKNGQEKRRFAAGDTLDFHVDQADVQVLAR